MALMNLFPILTNIVRFYNYELLFHSDFFEETVVNIFKHGS